MSCSLHLTRCCSPLLHMKLAHRPAKTQQFLFSRQIHKSVATSEVVTQGCETLPDLTVIWPFHLWPADVAATVLDQIQQLNEIPWWATIVVGAVLVKLPIFGHNIANFRKIQLFATSSNRQMTHFVLTYLNNLVTKGETHALKMANDERRYTIAREGTHRVRPTMTSHISYFPLYCIAGIHVTMFVALNWLNRIQYVPLLSGGLPWCANLTLADPYMILPAACVLTGCLSFYLHPVHWMLPVPEFQLKHFLYLSPALVVVFSILSGIPADYVVYMCSANLASCVLNSILKHPAVCNEVGVLSAGENFNRMVPPSHVFKDLGKTCERQVLLIEQKKEQLLLAEKKQKLLAEKVSVKLLDSSKKVDTVAESEKTKELPEDSDTIRTKDVRFLRITERSYEQPYLVDKVFTRGVK